MSEENKRSRDDEEEGILSKIDRRGFLAGLGATAATGAAVGGSVDLTQEALAAEVDEETVTGGDSERLTRAYDIREAAARDLLNKETGGTGVYERYDGLHGTFSKALPHNDLAEVDEDAYLKMDEALEGTDVEKYNDIPLAKGRPLANPIAARAYNLVGSDGHEKPMPKAPAVGSDEAAAEMVELYWRALLRDVPFSEYDGNELVQAAYDEITSLSGYEGPVGNGPENALFRTSLEGDTEGPLISQFLLQDIPFSAMKIENKLRPQVDEDFMTDEESFLNVRRGDASVVKTEEFEEERRRISNGRDLLTYVHRNIPSQSAINAAYYLLVNGYPTDDSINNSRNLETQNQFVEVGPPFVTTLVNGVVDNVKHATWYHKWLVHRRCRPEKYGGLVHFHKKSLQTGDDEEEEEEEEGRYPFLNEDLLQSEAVSETKDEYDTWLLPQGYPEGSPTHPSYPAGHAVFIGASVTVLKALFDGDAVLEETVTVGEDGDIDGSADEELTVRGELHKLASNHSFGRDFSGIHYRTDGTEGLRLGEKAALEYLKDELSAFAADIQLSLVGFDGNNITVTADDITAD